LLADNISQKILEYFDGLELLEFSGIDDERRFCEKIDISVLKNSDYGCGLFWFTKN